MSDLLPFETPGAVERDLADVISPIEQIIDDARNGRMFVLVDHEDRENEGDLVIPAQMATPEAINFMARYGRGLICLAMTSERADSLGLQLMSSYNSSRHETAVFPPMIAPIRLRLRLMRAKLPLISRRPVTSSPCAPAMAVYWCGPAIQRPLLIFLVWLD